MKIVLVAVCAAVLAACWNPAIAQDQAQLFLWAFQANPVTDDTAELGSPCPIRVGREDGAIMDGMPLFVTIENERHEVITVWEVAGEITEMPDGKRACKTADGFALPLPEASFWLVYVNDQFLAAYSPETLPKDDSSRLPVYLDFGFD